MTSIDQLSSLSYQEIQSKAIELGVSPMAPEQELVKAIAEILFSNDIMDRQETESAFGTTVDGNVSATTSNNNNNKKKRRRKKKNINIKSEEKLGVKMADSKDNESVQIDYVPEALGDISKDPTMSMFADVFSKFNEMTQSNVNEGQQPEEQQDQETTKKENGFLDDISDIDDDENDDDKEEDKLSNRKLRKMKRMKVVELKQSVKNPDDVDWVDITAADPKLLVHIKSYRNVVPVPFHWIQKRKYLQNKRGHLKKPFELPEFIRFTGVMDIRESVREKEDASKLRQKAREKMQPKMGKIEIDYQKLHDAFFRYQTKPKMSIHGQLYYEGKENETKEIKVNPGVLSDELKDALNMPPFAPPPWLINMQRYGPPPSYPHLRIPGLNAPIPSGAQWGYHPGGWGKPPVDEYNRPLYGDVFGQYTNLATSEKLNEPVERQLWGEFEIADEESEPEQEEDEEEPYQGEDIDMTEIPPSDGYETTGLVTPSGLTSIPAGLETPDHIELRKESRKSENKQLFTVLSQKENGLGGFVGSQHVYDLTSLSSTEEIIMDYSTSEGVEITLNPEDLEKGLSKQTLQKKLDESKVTTGGGVVPVTHQQTEDFSDMVAEHANKQARKKQKKDEKKKKDFKF